MAVVRCDSEADASSEAACGSKAAPVAAAGSGAACGAEAAAVAAASGGGGVTVTIVNVANLSVSSFVTGIGLINASWSRGTRDFTVKLERAILNVLLTLGIVLCRKAEACVPTSLSGVAGALLSKNPSIFVEEVASVDYAVCKLILG